jgi:hypothetical protein
MPSASNHEKKKNTEKKGGEGRLCSSHSHHSYNMEPESLFSPQRQQLEKEAEEEGEEDAEDTKYYPR